MKNKSMWWFTGIFVYVNRYMHPSNILNKKKIIKIHVSNLRILCALGHVV